MDDKRIIKDKIANLILRLLTICASMIVLLICLALYIKSKPILEQHNLSHLLLSTSWRPLKGDFGFLPFICGTSWVTLVAGVIAIPLSLLTAIFISEFATSKLRDKLKSLIDLLAGIPSVVYGVWGVLVIVPLIKDYIAPFFNAFSTGYSVLAGGIVLAIMIFPVIIHISVEVLQTVSFELRETTLALGATKWETVKLVVLRKSAPGIIAAIVLGLSRAFGETMAVLMVAGNVIKIPTSLFDPAYPLPALIANNYGEMLSIPLYDSALLLASLILLFVVLFFNIISRLILRRIERGIT